MYLAPHAPLHTVYLGVYVGRSRAAALTVEIACSTAYGGPWSDLPCCGRTVPINEGQSEVDLRATRVQRGRPAGAVKVRRASRSWYNICCALLLSGPVLL